MKKVKVTFIIPHKGRTDMLRQTVESILNQSCVTAEIQIVVVTQNSTLDQILSRTNAINIKLLTRPASDTVSALRNFGVKESDSDYLAFLDADIQISGNWLEVMLSTLDEQENLVLTSAIQVNSAQAPHLEKIRTALSNAEIDCEVNFLPGRNLFLRRETFNQVGGFPEHLVTCEDYYFTDQVHRIGGLFYTSKATYVHLGEDKKYAELFKKEIWRGQSNWQSIRGRNIPLREYPSLLVPLWILTFFIAMTIGLFVNRLELSVLCLLLILIPILLYTLRLFSMVKGEVGLFDVLRFYLVYFPARIIGTLGGLLKTFKV